MKKTFLTLALAAALPAFAQSSIDSQTNVGVTAGVGDIGITSIMQLPAANPFTTVNQAYSGGYKVSGMPVNSVAPSFSSPAVWRCSRAGGGGSAQGEKFGISFAFGGDDSVICGIDFRIAVAKNLIEMKVAASQEKDVAKSAAMMDAYVIGVRLACKDDDMADSFEGTTLECKAAKTDTRKARLAREAQVERQVQSVIVNGSPVAVMPGVPMARQQPQPWQAGG